MAVGKLFRVTRHQTHRPYFEAATAWVKTPRHERRTVSKRALSAVKQQAPQPQKEAEMPNGHGWEPNQNECV